MEVLWRKTQPKTPLDTFYLIWFSLGIILLPSWNCLHRDTMTSSVTCSERRQRFWRHYWTFLNLAESASIVTISNIKVLTCTHKRQPYVIPAGVHIGPFWWFVHTEGISVCPSRLRFYLCVMSWRTMSSLGHGSPSLLLIHSSPDGYKCVPICIVARFFNIKNIYRPT